MSFLSIQRVSVLPATPAPSTMYIVRSAHTGLVELYFTSSDGNDVRHILNKDEVQTMINQYVVNATSALTEINIVSNIAARNALSLTANGLCLVLDATADSSVSGGAALYIYAASNQTWTKVAEYESMDVQLLWSSIQGRPSSSVAAIDDAVAKVHVHANKVQLDKIGQDAGGNLLYNGSPPQTPLETVEW